MSTVRQHDQGIHVNDRKLEMWTLQKIGKSQYNPDKIQVQVYAVPKRNARGAETEYLKIAINGIVVKDTDINELRRKAQEVYSGLNEDEYEKVLIVEIAGNETNPANRGARGSDFGLDYSIGWKVKKLGVIFSQDKTRLITIENEDPSPKDDGDPYGISSRGKVNKTAVITWTQEREDVLISTIKNISKLRAEANKMVLDFDKFATLLDSKTMFLLGAKT